ncbi:DUF5522 domain-containing protein [Aeoliella sp.]|uniref:DUF5522 domain-containing protein n=1 Tax=Aeoliella sp. TaxID=2795800 RepID=UPI003CCBF503
MSTVARDETADYYVEQGFVVFTAAYLLRRGKCCGNGCRHCPYRDHQADSPPATIANGITDSGEHGPRGGPAADGS